MLAPYSGATPPTAASRTAMSYPAIPDMAHPIHSDAFIDTNWQSAFRNLTNNNLYHSHKSTLSHPQCPHKPSPTMHAQTSSFVTRILQSFKSSSSSRLSRRESIMSDSTTAYLYLQTSDCQSTSSTGVASKDYASAFALLQSSYGVGGNVSMHFTKSNTRRSRNKP